jgi:hypothetical protein
MLGLGLIGIGWREEEIPEITPISVAFITMILTMGVGGRISKGPAFFMYV